MTEDIRDKPFLLHHDVTGLNFVGGAEGYVFRRHFRTGLRSHIMEVLKAEEVHREREGVFVSGVRWFPRAKPLRMLRIFRTKFRGLEDAWEEIQRVKIIGTYLGPAHLALSEEFLVDYALSGTRHLLLCGLQSYVEGEILDPWRHHRVDQIKQILLRMNLAAQPSEGLLNALGVRVQRQAKAFVGRVKRMVRKEHFVPDLAGVGNLLLTPRGEIKLVDINNISEVTFGSSIPLDDRGYPVCDKSIEALSLLEEHLAGSPVDCGEPLYRCFLDPLRMEEVKAMEKVFHQSMKMRD
jgi:hypothetical protein